MRLRFWFAVQFLQAEAAATGNTSTWRGLAAGVIRMWILAFSSFPSIARPWERAESGSVTALIPLPLREANQGLPDGVEKNFPDPHSFLMNSSSVPYELFALLALIRSDRTTSGKAFNTGQS
jgi:hypothetical protein